MEPVNAVRAVPGRGLEGDRYFEGQGTYSGTKGSGRSVTLIEEESLEALARDYGVQLDPGESRRNIVTRNAPLNHLVGREFRIGEVFFRGMRLCEPCSHLAELSGAEVIPGLVHRGGLRADILNEGIIRVSDKLEPA